MTPEQNEELAKSVEVEGKELMDLAARADAGEDVDSILQSDTAGNRSPASKPASETTNTQKPTETIQKGDPKPVEAGKDSKLTDAAGKDPAKTEEEEKNLSQFEKAKRNAARKERSWEAINREKEAFKAEKEAMLSEKEEAIQKAKDYEKRLAETQAKGSKGEISAKEYEDAAKDYREDAKRLEERGEHEEADKLIQKARLCERVANERRTQEKQIEENQKTLSVEAETKKFHKAWDENLGEALKAFPELKDANSAIGKEMSRLISYKTLDVNGREVYPFQQFPAGSRLAAEVADAFTKAASLPAVQAKLAEIEGKYAELSKNLRIGPSGNPELPKSNKAFEEMTMDEQGAYLAKQDAVFESR